jgi:hypothetical protein
MTPGIPSVTTGGGTGAAMGVGGKMGFVTSGDTTGDVVTYEVGVPGNCIGSISVRFGRPAQGQEHVPYGEPLFPDVPLVCPWRP